MSGEMFLIAGLTILSVILFHFVQKTFALASFKIVPRRDSGMIVAIVVVTVVNLPYFFDPGRANEYELLRDGLSIGNIINVIDSTLIGVAALYLLAAARRLKFDLINGPSFWLVLLFMLYLVSAAWSVYPQGSAYRALELIAYYIVAIFIFTGRRPLHNLYWMMFLEVFFGAAVLAPGGITALLGGHIVGFMQSNQHSLYAAVFLLLHRHLYRTSISGYLYGLFFLLAFGSTTTFAAFLGGAALYFVYGYASGPIYLLRVPIALSIVGFYLFIIFYPEPFADLIDIVAPLVAKNAEKFSDASGRIELWQFYYGILKDRPFGIGFWSERVLFAGGYQIPWSATSAHNGFMSAWIGAGVPALGCLVMLYVSIITHLRRREFVTKRVCSSLLFMLFINSLTFPGIGGFFSMWYYVMAAVVVLSNCKSFETIQTVKIPPVFARRGRSALQAQT